MSARGRVFFIMHLAHELHMTRRELLNRMDAEEMTYWRLYFQELNTPTEKPQSKESLVGQLKNAFAFAKKGKGIK